MKKTNSRKMGSQENILNDLIDKQRAESRPKTETPEGSLTPSRLRGREGTYTKMVAEGFTPGLVKRPHMDVILQDAYTLTANEIRRLMAKAATDPDGLSLTETKQYALLAQQLVALAKEERAQVEEERFHEKSDKELLRLTLEAQKVLEEGED